jgi:Zn-dependent M28 family amino/carboxypeptidase
VVVFNEGQPGRTDAIIGTLGGPTVSIPVIGTTYDIGAELYNLSLGEPVTVQLTTETISETRQTENIIADSKKGDKNNVVVVGAHLDSVAEGPGINDNGSGTASILEIAIQVSRERIKLRNQLRFAFWGAEESGLLGSEFYVANLSPEELAKIRLNLNFDMLGSPNFVRFVYDGDGSDTPDAGPPGSEEIEQVFLDYFAKKGLQTEPTAFDGRSDYGPFIEVGIPAGGLFSGAEGIKTPEEAAVYGGTAGEAYDPCYHQACDDFGNVSRRGLHQLADAAAHAVQVFAQKELAPPVVTTLRAQAVTMDYRGPFLVQ